MASLCKFSQAHGFLQSRNELESLLAPSVEARELAALLASSHFYAAVQAHDVVVEEVFGEMPSQSAAATSNELPPFLTSTATATAASAAATTAAHAFQHITPFPNQVSVYKQQTFEVARSIATFEPILAG